MTQPLLELKGIVRSFMAGDREFIALKGIDLTIHAGEMVAITGASGSGKSTLMNILGGLDYATAGSYKINGIETRTLGDEQLAELRRDQIVLGGMETHVCVLQTALKLKQMDYEVVVAADATGSRHPERRRLGLERMRAHGVDITDSEMVLFEWMGNSGVPAFRELSRLIR